jgi:hypothetical protein
VEWLVVTLHIYRKVFSRAAVLAGKNWPVLGSVFVYGAIGMVAATLCLPLGIAGGLVLTLIQAACVSSFLYLVEMIVRTSKVTLDDFRRSFVPYLWDVVGIMFVFWIVRLLRPAFLQLPQGEVILLFVYLAIFVLFNAVPELIYLGHCSTAALLSESYEFITENWIEWFPATLLAVAVMVVVGSLPVSGAGVYVREAGLALLLYFTMVMRGLLFIELYGSTHRGRAFKYRMNG